MTAVTLRLPAKGFAPHTPRGPTPTSVARRFAAAICQVGDSAKAKCIQACPFAYDRELAKLDARWVIPKIVVTVKFSEWTDEDRLRAPVFLSIRTDVDPDTVRREET